MIRKDKQKNSSTSPLDVSVIVCTKNSANTIVECLKSIRENHPKEIILVDANSTDETKELARPYATKIIQDPGRGLAVARNYGLEQVKGRYVCNVGPDNVLPPGTLEKCIEYLKQNSHVGVSTQTVVKNPDKSYFSYAINPVSYTHLTLPTICSV